MQLEFNGSDLAQLEGTERRTSTKEAPVMLPLVVAVVLPASLKRLPMQSSDKLTKRLIQKVRYLKLQKIVTKSRYAVSIMFT